MRIVVHKCHPLSPLHLLLYLRQSIYLRVTQNGRHSKNVRFWTNSLEERGKMGSGWSSLQLVTLYPQALPPASSMRICSYSAPHTESSTSLTQTNLPQTQTHSSIELRDPKLNIVIKFFNRHPWE